MDVKEKSPPVTTRPKNFLDNFLTCRRVLNIMVFLGFMVNYMLRVNLNFAIVDMVFRPDNLNDTISTTTLPTIFDSDNHTRLTRSLSNAELALEDDEDDDDDDARKFRKNNFVGTNAAAPKQSTTSLNKPPSSGFQNFNPGLNFNASGGFQSSSQPKGFQFSGSAAGNPPGGFQSFSSGSTANQGGGFQSFSSSSGGNQGGFQSFNGGSGASGFQSSGNGLTTNNSNQFSATASETSRLNGSSKSTNSNPLSSSSSFNSQQFNEPIVQQTNIKNELQASPGTGQSQGDPVSSNSDQKVGLAANSLDDSILTEETSNGSRILFTGGSNKPLPEVANAQLEEQTQSSGSTAAPQGTKKKKRKRYQKPGVRRFTWSEAQQGYLIGSFFWGYILTELPGGRLAEIIGARKVFGYATLGASVVTLLTPMCAKIHFILILLIRIMLGLFLGPTWPSILPLAGKWIPMDERGKFLSNMMGSTLGAGFTLPICGYIIDNFSWEYVFYITGLLGFIWSVLWFLLVFETPAEHPRITPEERRYIESKLGLKSSKSPNNNYNNEEKQVAQGLIINPGDESCLSDNEQKSSDECRNYSTFARNGEVNNSNSDGKAASRDKSSTGSIAETNGDTFKKSTSNVTDKSLVAASNNSNFDANTAKKQSGHARAPWLHIITSIPVWAFVLTHGASVFGYNTITNQLPTFMDHILNYEIKENGILSSFPYIGKYIAALVGGTVADKLLRSSRFTKNFVRKLLTTIGVFIPGCLMLFQIFVGSDKTFSIFVFTAALTANGVVVGGYLGNSLDIAPCYSGTVFGLANMFSGLSGAVSALLVGYLTDHNQVYGQWQKVFLIVAITYICGALIFLIFGSTEVQPWNYSSEQQKKKNEMESDLDEETGILQATRKRSSLSSVLRSYGTEDKWDTSSYLSGPDSANKLRKKRHRKTPRPETEFESIDSSARKKHLRFDPQSYEISTLKPLMGDQHHDSDTLSVSSDYAERNKTRGLEEQAVVHVEDVKLRKPRSERNNNEDYLLSIKKRASYKEAIENGSHSDYSYDSENKTRSPSMKQHERKIKNRSDSNESEQTTSRIKKDTRKRSNQEEQISPSETSNEKKTRKNRHKNRKTHGEEEYNTDENENTVDNYPVTKSNKREAYSKKLKSPTSQQSTSTDSDSDNNTQNGSRKKAKKFQIIDAASSQLRHVSSKLYPKSTKKEEKTLKNDPQSSTSSNQNTSIDQSPTKDDDDDTKPESKLYLPLSSEPKPTIKHASSSPL